MAELSAGKRSRLPDTAFAYVDSQGRRRLPINDESHVRNALGRFGRIAFETEAARQKALARLMRAAKKYGIVPVGFMTQQLRAQARPMLPVGALTLLFADIEDSTGHLRRLADRYSSMLTDVRTILRAATRRGGHEVDARADEFFVVFPDARAALDAALAIQRAMRDRAWPDAVPVRLRIGIHRGRPTPSDGGYVGLAVNTAARICEVGHGGQTLISAAAAEAVAASMPPGTRTRSIGSHRLRGMRDTHQLLQLEADDLESTFPPLRIAAASSPTHRPLAPAGLAHHSRERADGGAVAD